MPLFGRKKKEEDPVQTLARCITLADDTRAYRRKDPEQMDAVFSNLKKTRFREHYDQWAKARPAAEKIADLPLMIPGVERLIQGLSWLKVANRVFLIFLVIFIAVQLVPAWRSALGGNPFGGHGLLYATIFVLLAVGSMNVATLIDFRIRRKIVAYEEQTRAEYAPARDKMKDLANKMLHSLAKEANRKEANRSDYSLILYFDDYDGIEVVKHWQPRSMGIFKKHYSHYQIVPKL